MLQAVMLVFRKGIRLKNWQLAPESLWLEDYIVSLGYRIIDRCYVSSRMFQGGFFYLKHPEKPICY